MLTNMAHRFRAKGVTCDVVALLRRPSPLEQLLLSQDISLRFTEVGQLYSPTQIFALTRLLCGYDLIHVHLFPAQLWTVAAALRMKQAPPLVTTEHSTENSHRRWWFRPVDRWMYKNYRNIACISEATAEKLVEWSPGITERITVVPNGIALDEFENATPAAFPDVDADALRIVFVGRFELQKDHSTLLRALRATPKAHLFLVGDGPRRPRMEQLARALGIANRVSFLGWRQDVAAVLKASHIYVHSTHYDGFGIAACEAMAAGLPVVASDVPGLAQLVADVGYLFPAGNDTLLAQQLKELIESPERRLEMSRAGVGRARQFGIDRTVDGYIRMYEGVLGQSTPTIAELR
jgi:glycosyltransferase involved in cell wall biosynthesis